VVGHLKRERELVLVPHVREQRLNAANVKVEHVAGVGEVARVLGEVQDLVVALVVFKVRVEVAPDERLRDFE